jgi:tetratricopeptide (TPR) repeat protein
MIIRKEQGDLEGAMNDFSHAIELDPQNKMAYLGRGEVRERRADFKGALADFQKVLEMDPANTEALKEIEEVRDKMKAATPTDRKKTPAKTPVKIAKSKPLRMDQMDQLEAMPYFGPK